MVDLRLAIDTGGTFTDVIALDDAAGKLVAVKVPSTPDDPSRALMEGIFTAVARIGRPLSDVDAVIHGTTTATNALLEHRFEGLGLLVTQGFRHLIEIARQSVPDGYGNSYFWVKPPRIVPLHLVREVSGRLTFNGQEHEALDEEALLDAVRDLQTFDVNRLGVCFLHSYANDVHERRAGELIRHHFPDMFVSLSSVVLPEYREYERAMTTLIDAMAKPYVETYLRRAVDQLAVQVDRSPFLIMQSNGGVVTADTAAERPVTMLLSGPAGGVLGAMHMAELAGFRDVLTLDAGGTSTDVSLVEGLRPEMTTYSLIEHYPVKTPMIDIATVGTGGGSIAWIDDYGALKVGPRSAGSRPGPICYGRGGEEPTVTDAALVLGRLPSTLIGGKLDLEAEAARAAFEEVSRHLTLTTEEAAAGVLEIAAANQVNGIRRVTVTKGRDPSLYALVVFGGAGALLATEVADFLGIRTVMVPPNPGNLSAFGLHVSDVKRDYVRTLVRRQSIAHVDELEEVWVELEHQGHEQIVSEGVAPDAIVLRRSADMRYVGEGHEVRVDLPDGIVGPIAVATAWEQFHRVHERTFGFEYEGQQDVEIVSLRVQATGRLGRAPTVPLVPLASHDGGPHPRTTRSVYWRTDGWVECDIFDRDELTAGAALTGPVVIEEYGSTVVLPRGWRLSVDPHGILLMEGDR